MEWLAGCRCPFLEVGLRWLSVSLAGLGQVLDFMYTAKLSLSSENVDDVLAVASFLQMQDIITACHALKSFAEPATSSGESTTASAMEGTIIGRLLRGRGFGWGLFWTVSLLWTYVSLSGLASIVGHW